MNWTKRSKYKRSDDIKCLLCTAEMNWIKRFRYKRFDDMKCFININLPARTHSINVCAKPLLVLEALYIKTHFSDAKLCPELILRYTDLWIKQVQVLSMKSSHCSWKYCSWTNSKFVTITFTFPNRRVCLGISSTRHICALLQNESPLPMHHTSAFNLCRLK